MSLAFGSTIHFVSAKRYSEENLRLMMADTRPMLRHWDWGVDQFKPGQRGTDSIANCIGGGVTNGGDAGVFHMQPLSENVNADMNGQFATYTIRLDGAREPHAKMGGLMAGAHNMPNNPLSEALFKKLRGLFKGAGIPLTMFVGTKHRGVCDMVYDSVADTWFVSLHRGETRQPFVPRSLDELQREYQYVDVSPQDTLRFGSG